MTALRKLLDALEERLSGSKPGLLRAVLVSIMVGFAAAVLTFRLLRSDG